MTIVKSDRNNKIMEVILTGGAPSQNSNTALAIMAPCKFATQTIIAHPIMFNVCIIVLHINEEEPVKDRSYENLA